MAVLEISQADWQQIPPPSNVLIISQRIPNPIQPLIGPQTVREWLDSCGTGSQCSMLVHEATSGWWFAVVGPIPCDAPVEPFIVDIGGVITECSPFASDANNQPPYSPNNVPPCGKFTFANAHDYFKWIADHNGLNPVGSQFVFRQGEVGSPFIPPWAWPVGFQGVANFDLWTIACNFADIDLNCPQPPCPAGYFDDGSGCCVVRPTSTGQCGPHQVGCVDPPLPSRIPSAIPYVHRSLFARASGENPVSSFLGMGSDMRRPAPARNNPHVANPHAMEATIPVVPVRVPHPDCLPCNEGGAFEESEEIDL